MHDPDSYAIILGRQEHLAQVPGIELAAAALFPENYLPKANREQTVSRDVLERALGDDCLWIAMDKSDVAVGFAVAEMSAGAIHLLEMGVLPRCARRGIGSALVRAVVTEARARGKRYVTLTTFRGLAWNEHFYAKFGFREVPPSVLDPALATCLRDEAAHGLDPALRLAMRLDVMAD